MESLSPPRFQSYDCLHMSFRTWNFLLRCLCKPKGKRLTQQKCRLLLGERLRLCDRLG